MFPSKKAVSPVIAIVLLLMMTVAAAGAAYFWLTSMQSSMQESSRKSIENIMESTGRRVTAQATLCKPTYPYEGLKGYWTIDDYNSTGVLDVSGSNNFGAFKGTAFGTDNITGGQVGKALEFDATEDYIEVPDDDSLDIINSITLSAWVYPRKDLEDEYGGIIKKIGNYFLYVAVSGHLYFRVASGGTTYSARLYDWVDAGHYGDWYHIVATWGKNTDGGRLKLYVNGEEASYNVQDSLTSSLDTSSDILKLGQYGGATWNGTLDEPRIYDRALSPNEIQELYEAENHSARRRIDVTVRNIGSEEIPKATWVANLKHDGTTVETDACNASSIDTGELETLNFYFADFKPNTKYTIDLQGTGTSTTVSC